METFLKLVAHDLYQKTNGDLSKVAVVFPNKRAGLFFNEWLATESDKPLWAPAYVSISELFRQCNNYEVGDPIKLVCELYKVFIEATGSKESLDEFYFWGEMLIADFDDADKNMADTDALFGNLKDLNELIDKGEFLEEGQREALSQFFHNFSIDEVTELKKRFMKLWDVLGDIYHHFKAELANQGLAYEGMLYREVAENMDLTQLPYEHYVFVGFNVLNRVEHQLFSKLQKVGKAWFYWDYDHFYMNTELPHEAGEFIRRNLNDFPSELPEEAFNNINKPKDVEFIESATENGQARFLPQWLRENLTEKEKETAIVLCNEALLQPVLHSLPENVKNLNVTMGFPLQQTPTCSLIEAILDLHTDGYINKNGRFQYEQVMGVLKHPYMKMLTPEAEKLKTKLTNENRFYPLPSELSTDNITTLVFTPVKNNLELCKCLCEVMKCMATIYEKEAAAREVAYDQLYREALFKCYTLMNRFYSLTEAGDLQVERCTMGRLIKRVMSTANIPFHGEPAIGLQVMGVLETRNLDFKHLIMLSVNEGQLPKAGGDTSFIPYNLRKAFGMTTIDHKIAVYAYYFYRLIQRAEKITLVYNTASDGMNQGELSRFMLQFLIEWNGKIKRKSLQMNQSPQGTSEICINKNPEIMRRMQDIFDRRVNPKALLSPSALNSYLDCRLKFYYKYVAKLTAPEEVTSEVDAARFGTIFHYSAEQIYKILTERNSVINKEDLENLLKDDPKLQQIVDNGFRELFFKIPPHERPEYNGIQLVNSAVIVRYVKQLLQQDLKYAPFTFSGSEKKVTEDIDIQTPKGIIRSKIGGIIDRMDIKDGLLRIVDYKTGGDTSTPTGIDAIFFPDKKRPGYIFQTFLYAAIVCKKLRDAGKKMKVAPALLYIHRAAAEDYSPIICMGESRKPKEPVDDFEKLEENFRKKLSFLLEEIFNPEIAFNQTDITEKCTFCEFKTLCKR